MAGQRVSRAVLRAADTFYQKERSREISDFFCRQFLRPCVIMAMNRDAPADAPAARGRAFGGDIDTAARRKSCAGEAREGGRGGAAADRGGNAVMPDNHERGRPLERKLILIVDDEIINREILGALLSEDYDVIYAADGQEAISLIQRHSDTLSLVLLDLMMPVMSGMVVLKRLSDQPELSRIPVIVMTADQEAEVACLG